MRNFSLKHASSFLVKVLNNLDSIFSLGMMKRAIVFVVLALVLFLSAGAFAVSEHIEYGVSVGEDGSAVWTIVQVTDIDSSVDGWEEFEEQVLYTIGAAKNGTGREMGLDFASLEMNTQINWETSSKTIVYVFRWVNFSVVEDGQIRFGDVFFDGFFSFLYGDGELYLTCPSEYVLGSSSFRPDQWDDSAHAFHWYRTQDFLVGAERILLVRRDAVSADFFNPFAAAVLGSAVMGVAVIGFFIFKRRMRPQEGLLKPAELPLHQSESDQEKILQLIDSSGGNLKQSEVCDKLRFSRAKTSLLLAEMEKNSLVRRSKKGKNKIVFRMEG